MRLVSLRLQNFRAHVDTSIDFPAGVVGIIGSNESGKSTVLEAIGFALYGAEATRGKLSSLRWKGAVGTAQPEVTLRFEVAGVLHEIRRSVRSADIQSIDAVDDTFAVGAVLASGTSAVNEYVPKLLGMTYREFAATYLCQQKDLDRIAAMGPTERATFFRSVTGLDGLDRALDACRKSKNDLQSRAEGAGATLGSQDPLLASLNEARSRAVDLRDKVKVADEDRIQTAENLESEESIMTEADHIRARWAALVERTGAWKIQLEKAERDVARAKEAKARVDEHDPTILPDIRKRLEELRIEKAKIGERREIERSLARLTETAGRTRAEIQEAEVAVYAYVEGEVEDLRERYREAKKAASALEASRVGRVQGLKAETVALEAEIESIVARLEVLDDLGDAATCPTCGQALGALAATVRETLEEAGRTATARQRDITIDLRTADAPTPEEMKALAEVDRLEKAGQQSSSRLDRKIDAARRLEGLRPQLVDIEAELGALRSRLDALPEAVDVAPAILDLERLEKAAVKTNKLVDADRSIAGTLEDAEDRLDEAAAMLEATDAKIAEIGHDETRYQAKADRLKAAKQRDREASDLFVRLTAEAKAAAEALEAADRAVDDYAQRASAVLEMREAAAVEVQAAELLNAFRVAAGASLRPELEDLASGFIAVLTDGRHESIELSESFEATLFEDGVPMEVVSGGGQDVTALAIRLAVSQTIAARAGQSMDLLILDEPFGSLDAVRRGNVLDLLRRLRSIFPQVLLISHVEETREAVDVAIELEHIGDRVTVTEAA